jgi:hypothetical protein
MGLEVEQVTGGCCGLAGSWGFESDHYDISMACGEQAILPQVREAAPETLIVANGFSCKTQIEQGRTGRKALHLAQVMKVAREASSTRVDRPRPERGYYLKRPSAPLPRRVVRIGGLVAVGGAAVAAGLVAARSDRR